MTLSKSVYASRACVIESGTASYGVEKPGVVGNAQSSSLYVFDDLKKLVLLARPSAAKRW